MLCIPFFNVRRAAGESERLRRLNTWLTDAAAGADIALERVQGAYDSYRQIADRIQDKIAEADLVVAATWEANPNVFFETGFAHGIGKPVLYVVHESEEVPFDVAGVESFLYGDLDVETGRDLADAMARLLTADAPPHPMTIALPRLRRHLGKLTTTDDLYGRVVRRALHENTNWVTSWSDNLVEILGREGVLRMGTFIMSQVQREGFATAYHSGHASWRQEADSATPDYFEATREAVIDRRVCITRVYVIDEPRDLDEVSLRERVWADASAGLDVRYLLKADLPDSGARDFGIWDDELLAEIHYSTELNKSPILRRCNYWSDEHRIARAREWRDRIERVAEPCPDLPSERALLEESAVELIDRGKCTIGASQKPDGDCSAYHTSWQPLRLGDAVSTPRWHASFYTRHFRQWSSAAHDRETDEPLSVLITGLADYGMLYWVAQSIAPPVRARCRFDVLDICQTPLDSCRWLRDRLKRCDPPMTLQVEGLRRDVFRNKLPDASYDLITSDAFLTRFAGDDPKRTLMEEWMRLLRPGGMLVTTARVRETPDDITPNDRDLFVSRVRMAARERGLALDVSKIAGDYADFIQSYPFAGEADVKAMVESVATAHGARASVECSLIPNWEMTQANYARIVVTALAPK